MYVLCRRENRKRKWHQSSVVSSLIDTTLTVEQSEEMDDDVESRYSLRTVGLVIEKSK